MEIKEALKKAAKEGRKIRYGERMTLKIVKKTKHYKVGQIITPHTVMGEVLLKSKVAEKVD